MEDDQKSSKSYGRRHASYMANGDCLVNHQLTGVSADISPEFVSGH